MTHFPEYVTTYLADPDHPSEVFKPEGKTTVTLTVSETTRFAAGGNAGPIPPGGINDGTGTFHVHPFDALGARTFDVSAIDSISFTGSGEVAIIWS